MSQTATRTRIDAEIYAAADPILTELTAMANLDAAARARICANAADLVRQIRTAGDPGMMEVFLAEYGLSTDEGIALMCLAEALLRVPDAETIDALIEDKIAPSDWGRHLGKSNSSLVNASTWALMLTGKVLEDAEPGIVGALRGAVRRLGEPVIRSAVARAMKEMGRQFVLGETIESAMKRAAGMEEKGFTYSYDMLGEAACTEADALAYLEAYSTAIRAISAAATHGSVAENPGISVKLSALHPRYEEGQRDRVLAELAPRLLRLAREAAKARIGFNIDAEEADRLALSLDVIEAVLNDPALEGWEGFGIVVQAYGKRARHVIDWIAEQARRSGRRIMVRLVKGAYWDAEIKRAQVLGLEDFPVFTRKEATDISYLANARKLLSMAEHIYPQFATHNAHTVAGILEMARQMGISPAQYEFQRLHGMGEVLHRLVMAQNQTNCRIYAPVGAHRDLLAYLVRRLLENGANSSFVNQIVNEEIAPETVAACPWEQLGAPPALAKGPDLFAPERRNSRGHDLTHRPTLAAIDAARAPWREATWQAAPLMAGAAQGAENRAIHDPAAPARKVGEVRDASTADADAAFAAAQIWNAPAQARADALRRAADLYEAHMGELFALLAREAGKTLPDAEGELREAVDFLRYYAAQAEQTPDAEARGTWVCISPWNFPLAIFTGQIAAALASGNAVIAKPSEETTLIGHRAAQLLHEAGVPRAALQLLPGAGDLGAALTSDARLDGVAFTGSTETARLIRRAMANHARPGTPLIAETGGLNAMIVDSTALPEHAIRDVIASAFQSAGQRCSALRCLYVQQDIAEHVTEMLKGAMDALRPGAPWDLSSDLGPVIDASAKAGIDAHIATARAEGRLLHEIPIPEDGHFVAPTLIAVEGIDALHREIFGPVLHLATFRAEDLDRVIDKVNERGYGLTFGLHTRIDDRVQHVVERVACGNIYVNRNQIGAIVGSQPFGGEGLSGTGPKAGGPRYLSRFRAPEPATNATASNWESAATAAEIINALQRDWPIERHPPQDMPGPTGESNRLSAHAKGPVLCLGPGLAAVNEQARATEALGGQALRVHGQLQAETLTSLPPFAAALWWGDEAVGRSFEQALAARQGPLVPLITAMPDPGHVLAERHVCVDTTASGGNAQLLAQMGGETRQASP